MNDFIEIHDGLYYSRTTGKPYSSRQGPLRELKAKDNNGYLCVSLNGKTYRWHQLVWRNFNGRYENVIDHIDGNPSNNLISNLRNVTQGENVLNSRYKGMTGASWHKRMKKWVAHIRIKGKKRWLGSFASEWEAHLKWREEKSLTS